MSSAPATLWTVIDPTMFHEDDANADGIRPTGMVEHSTNEDHIRSRARLRDEAMNRTETARKHLVVEYAYVTPSMRLACWEDGHPERLSLTERYDSNGRWMVILVDEHYAI